MSDRWTIPVGSESTRAIHDAASTPGPVLVCAHGAGATMEHAGMRALADALVARGVSVVRFDFLYTARGDKRPDPMPLLTKCFVAVVARVREELAPTKVLLGGRSMGGRAASMMCADGFACDGLVLFAYPLHPAKQPDKLRDAHIPRIAVPVLAFSGTKDALCTRALMERAAATATAPWDMRWIDGADHSFHVPKRSGRTDAQVLDEVAATTAAWAAAR